MSAASATDDDGVEIVTASPSRGFPGKAILISFGAALPDAHRVGFADAGQAVDRLALEPHDIRLHGVLTETGYRAVQ